MPKAEQKVIETIVMCATCDDHRGAEFCIACGEDVDEDGNTESLTLYCSRHCGCVGTGCPMGLIRRDD
jgi:hypothetical protein